MSILAQTWVHEHTSPNISTWAYQPKHEYMSILAQTWVHEHTSPNMSTWAYQPKHEYMSMPAQTWVHELTSPNMSTWAYQPKHEYMSIPAQTWVHEIVGNSKDVSILYEITGDWWQRYYIEYNWTDYMSKPAQTWVHEHTSPNMSTWACQPNMSTWAYQPKHEYMSNPAQTWVHEIVGNSKDVSILYEITGDWWQRYYMILHRIQLYWLHEHTSPNMSTWDCREQ